jgi:hypothetical protein
MHVVLTFFFWQFILPTTTRNIIKGFSLVLGRLDKVKIIETFSVTKKHLTASYLGGVGIHDRFGPLDVFMKIPLISANN